MSEQLTIDNFQQALNLHVAEKGAEIRAKYGPYIGWNQLLEILADRACVRYPCEISFEAAPLRPGELAHPVSQGERPESGFVICVQPLFLRQLEQVPALVLYQLVLVNYGPFASADDAETFGGSALGLSKDEYYDTLCRMAGMLEDGSRNAELGFPPSEAGSAAWSGK
ncbi:hypothetical protein SBV1_1890042 [Verrucomicrobia bacterium]|nr:hypothetical protein SBV1_1890042 [Verrucomicrobiota bacterium]